MTNEIDPTSAEWRAELRRMAQDVHSRRHTLITAADILALLDAYEAALVTISLLGNMEHMRQVVASHDEFAAGDEGKTLAQIHWELAAKGRRP